MRRIISKVRSKLSSDENGRSSGSDPEQEPTWPPADDKPEMQPPTALDVLRYRYQYGVNLGGIFVLEKWISPGMFESWTKEGSELDAVTASVLYPFHSLYSQNADLQVAFASAHPT